MTGARSSRRNRRSGAWKGPCERAHPIVPPLARSTAVIDLSVVLELAGHRVLPTDVDEHLVAALLEKLLAVAAFHDPIRLGTLRLVTVLVPLGLAFPGKGAASEQQDTSEERDQSLAKNPNIHETISSL